jgi:hypothetical protein
LRQDEQENSTLIVNYAEDCLFALNTRLVLSNFAMMYNRFIYFFLWTLFFFSGHVSGRRGRGRILQINNDTGAMPHVWDRYCMVTQYTMSSFTRVTDPGSQSLLLAASSRVFMGEHAKSPGNLHTFVTFTQEDLHDRSAFASIQKFHQPLQLAVSFRENANVLKTTFLEAFRDADKYIKDGFEYLIYVSPSSVVLTKDLVERVYGISSEEEEEVDNDGDGDDGGSDDDDDDDVVYCNALPYSMALVLELFQFDVHAVGLAPETTRALLLNTLDEEVKEEKEGSGVFCGVDVFVLPTHLLARLSFRAEALMTHMLLHHTTTTTTTTTGPADSASPPLPLSRFREEHRDYFFSAVLFNMILLEEGVRVQQLPLLNDATDNDDGDDDGDGDTDDTTTTTTTVDQYSESSGDSDIGSGADSDPSSLSPSSGVLIFPPPLASPVLEPHSDISIFIPSDLVTAAEGDPLGLSFSLLPLPDPDQNQNQCVTTVHGLMRAEEVSKRYQKQLCDNIFCLVAGQLSVAVSRRKYLEVNGLEALLRAGPGQDGHSLLLLAPSSSSSSSLSCGEVLSGAEISGRMNYLGSLNTLECAEQQQVLSMSVHLSTLGQLPSFLRLNGCWDNKGAFLLAQPAVSATTRPIKYSGQTWRCSDVSSDVSSDRSSDRSSGQSDSSQSDSSDSALEDVYSALMAAPTEALPCLLLLATPSSSYTITNYSGSDPPRQQQQQKGRRKAQDRFSDVMLTVGLVELSFSSASPSSSSSPSRERNKGQGKQKKKGYKEYGDVSAAIGPHCQQAEFASLSKLLEPRLASLLDPLLLTNTLHKQKNKKNSRSDRRDKKQVPESTETKEFFPPRLKGNPFYTFPSGGVGINLLRSPSTHHNNNSADTSKGSSISSSSSSSSSSRDISGRDSSRFATSIEHCLPRDIFRLLQGRLRHRSYVALGANSHFIPFDGSAGRSVVEKIILQYLAPLVVGPQVSRAVDQSVV